MLLSARKYAVCSLAFLNLSCAGTEGLLLVGASSVALYSGLNWYNKPTPKKAVEAAAVLRRPSKNGRFDPVSTMGKTGEFQPMKYSKRTKEICINHRSELAKGVYQISVVGSPSTVEKPISTTDQQLGRLIRTTNKLVQIQTTKVTSHKDSSGKEIGTSETPITKSELRKIYHHQVCFRNFKFPDSKSFYVVLGASTEKPEKFESHQDFVSWKII